MTRLTVLLAATLGMSSSAFACGMYLPEENQKMLAQVLEDIDAQAGNVVVEAVQPTTPEPAIADAALVEPNEAQQPTLIPEATEPHT